MGNNLIKFFLFIIIISLLLLNSGFILIIIQSIINIIFYYEKTKEIIAEKIVYEQFSHEIYSNIKSKIYYDMHDITKSSECNYELVKFPLRMEYFYDCEGVYDDKIDKKLCQDKITSPKTCCEVNCCRDYIINKEKKHICSEYSYFNFYDPRNDICSYISIYNGKFYYINNYKYCAMRLDKSYEDLLLDYDSNRNCMSSIIIFDSANHYFCYGDYGLDSYYDLSNYYYNYNYNYQTIAQNIFSTVQPNYINIENSFRISKLLNDKNYDESKYKKELKKLNELSNKNIEDAFKKKDDHFTNYYHARDSYSASYLFSGGESIFSKFNDNSFYQNANINWYTRSYIGFRNIKELKKFKKYFDENNHKNNSLYKLSTSELFLSISVVSIIIIGILIILEILYLIYLPKKKKLFDEKNIPIKDIIYLLIISIFSFIFFLIIYLSCFICNFDSIEIKMEKFFQRVLEKYMERRDQLYLKISIILFSGNIIILVVFLLYIKIRDLSKGVINSRPINILVIKFRLKEVNCEHKIKIDKNKSLKDYFNIFENIIEKCPTCSQKDFLGIENILLNNESLNIENKIESLKLNEESVLIIDDDS